MININPFFSVVIPTYNRADVLSRSVDSVLGQVFQNFELIIVDNGSTDDTQKWLSHNYQDDRIVYHYQEGSGSPASPRNVGMSLAKGQWICLLDSDDRWDKRKLQFVFDTIQKNTDSDVICHNENIYYETTDRIGKVLKYGPVSNNMYKEMLILGNRLSTSATSIRAKFIKKNNLQFNELDEFAIVEDYDLWLNLAKCNANFVFIPESLGFYTVGESNMIANSDLYCENLRNLLEMHSFNIQQFSDDKEKLWKLLKLRFDICKIQHSKASLLKKLISVFKIWIVHPINLTKIILGYAKRKLSKDFNFASSLRKKY
jgi:glycosyltransferase involved in cell wall biosynthesis